MSAILTFKLKAESGYTATGAYPAVTPEQWNDVQNVLAGRPTAAEKRQRTDYYDDLCKHEGHMLRVLSEILRCCEPLDPSDEKLIAVAALVKEALK